VSERHGTQLTNANADLVEAALNMGVASGLACKMATHEAAGEAPTLDELTSLRGELEAAYRALSCLLVARCNELLLP
jgi:hypothetical protein